MVYVFYHNFWKSKVDCIKYLTEKKIAWLSGSSPLSLLCSGSLYMDAGSTEGHRGGWGTYDGLLHWRNQTAMSFPISLSVGTQTILSAWYSMVIAPTQLGASPSSLTEASFGDLSCPIVLCWGCTSVLLCLSYLYRWLKTLCLYKLETIRLSQQRQPEAIF